VPHAVEINAQVKNNNNIAPIASEPSFKIFLNPLRRITINSKAVKKINGSINKPGIHLIYPE
jgi:hypothetical protein